LANPSLILEEIFFLPPSALDRISQTEVTFPLQFELTNHFKTELKACGGVIDFTAEEGKIFVPTWMMDKLQAKDGEFIRVRTISTQKGEYMKIEPHSKIFLDISDPKAVLEQVLRDFIVVSLGQIISFQYNGTLYKLNIVDMKPFSLTRSICVKDTDIVLDFAPPLDYIQPQYIPKQLNQSEGKSNVSDDSDSEEEEEKLTTPKFKAFSGSGHTLKGESKASHQPSSSSGAKINAPSFSFSPKFQAFQGVGYSLK